MKIKLFESFNKKQELIDCFQDISDEREVEITVYNIEDPRNHFINPQVNIFYRNKNDYNEKELKSSIYQVSNLFEFNKYRVYFFFQNLENTPMRSFTDDFPSLENLLKLYNSALLYNGKNEWFDEPFELKVYIEFSTGGLWATKV